MTSTLLSSIAAVAIAVWIGSIVFQSFVVAPTIFKRLPPESAGVVLRALFPRFFRLGLLCGLVALGALYVFGGEVLRGFTFIMIFGVLVGTYSSIFIGAPLLSYMGAYVDRSPPGSGVPEPQVEADGTAT